MRIQAGGGGSGAPSLKTSFADALATTSTTIAPGDGAMLPYNALTTIPTSSSDYAIIPDNGDGGPGLQLKASGTYQLYLVFRPIHIADGFITLFADPGAGHGTTYPSAFELNPTMLSGTFDLLLPLTYFTNLSGGIDAMGLFVQNNTSAQIIVLANTAHILAFKLGPSPTP